MPIVLKVSGGEAVRLSAKVDTGAEFCIFQREYAEQLNIDVAAGERKRFKTAAGSFETYGHLVGMSCLDWEFDSVVYFAAEPEFTRNVVGRNGWLQYLRIGIIDHDSTILISHYNDD